MDRVTLAEAATRLGVSEQTVRRRLKTGELQGEREVTAQGYRWWVDIPETAKGPDKSTPPASTGGDTERLIQRLEAENTWLRDQVAEATRERRMLLAFIGKDPEMVRLLASPLSPDDQSNILPTQPPLQSPSQKPTRRRWFKRGKP